jgi:hypothetical protein
MDLPIAIAFFDELEKISKDDRNILEKLIILDQKLKEHVPTQAAIHAVSFGTLGGLYGHGKKPGLGTALGILAGGVGGAGLGYGTAKLYKHIRERKERKG